MPTSVMHMLDPSGKGSADTPAQAIAARSPTGSSVARGPSAATAPFETCHLPGDARILVIPDRSEVSAQIRNRRYVRLPAITIIGPSSQPVTLRIDGVAPTEIPLTAMEWSRLTTVSACMIADRIVPAADLGPHMASWMDELLATRTGNVDATALTDLTDAIGSRAAHRPDIVEEPVIRALMALIDEGIVYDAATASDRMGTSPHLLRRIALRWFGFPPKTLLIRRRFLMALERFRTSSLDFTSVAPLGYYDASHFLRDANRFLGTTPRRYLRRVDGAIRPD